jgi:hypothetical protein
VEQTTLSFSIRPSESRTRWASTGLYHLISAQAGLPARTAASRWSALRERSILRANLAADYVYGPPNIGHLSCPNPQRPCGLSGLRGRGGAAVVECLRFGVSVVRGASPVADLRLRLAALVEKPDSRHAR